MLAAESGRWADRDQEEGYRAALRSFQALSRPADHRRDWAAWAAGWKSHVLLVVPIRDRSTVDEVQRVQAELAGVPGLELHPRHFLHVSVQSFGFLSGRNGGIADGELDLRGLERLVPRLARALAAMSAFELSLGRVNAFHSSIFLETWSAGRLLQVRGAARTAAAGAVALQRIDPFPGFLFHLTIGYLSAAVPLGTLRRSLRAVRAGSSRSVPCRVDALELVRLPADQREPYPALECLARFPLQGAPMVASVRSGCCVAASPNGRALERS